LIPFRGLFAGLVEFKNEDNIRDHRDDRHNDQDNEEWFCFWGNHDISIFNGDSKVPRNNKHLQV
jgi:hypothetical protein